MEEILYFGTSLHDAGHYLWCGTGNHLQSRKTDFKIFPFHPEDFPKQGKDRIEKGSCFFYTIDGYSILAYEGSIADDRWGSKCVFFTKGIYTNQELLLMVKNIPVYKQIITQLLIKYKKINASNGK
jgi:hypothetical protein